MQVKHVNGKVILSDLRMFREETPLLLEELAKASQIQLTEEEAIQLLGTMTCVCGRPPNTPFVQAVRECKQHNTVAKREEIAKLEAKLKALKDSL